MKVFHRMLSIFFVALFVVLSGTAFAQDSSEASDDTWYYGKVIKSISFKGLKSVDSRDLNGVISGFVGKQFTDELFYSMIDRIDALEFFDDISPEALPGDSKKHTVSIVFNVKERPVVTRINMVGNHQIRTTELKETISAKEKDVFVADKLLIDERSIRDKYLSKGFTNVKVSSSTKETEKGIEITFKIDEGRSTVITKIEFSGNKLFSSKKLRGQISLKKKGVFKKGAFQESALESDRMAIITYYQNSGYMDADVVDVTKETFVNEKKNRNELTITFYIQEGAQYTYTGVSFQGNEIFSDEKLAACMKLKEGEPFNQTKFREGYAAIADMYYENGYTSNQFTPIQSKDPESRTISFVITIEERSRSHIENVVIKGNTKTKDYVIRREIPIESGDIFSKDKISTGLRNLYNLQFFSAVVPEVLPGSEENLVDVVFSVEEQSTTAIELGVTFSGVSDADDLPFAVYGKWTNSNLFGTGRSLSVSATGSTKQQSFGLSLEQGWLFGKPISVAVSTEFSHAEKSGLRLKIDKDGIVNDEDYFMDYTQWRWTNSFAIGRRWTPDWAILSVATGVSSSLINNVYDEDLWTPLDITISDYANKWGLQNSVWTSFSIDDRDINYNPSTGWFASQKLTWFGLLPMESEFFLRTDTKLEKYFTLFNKNITDSWNFRVVLALYTGLSLEIPAPETSIGNSSKLYIDGMFNARGWTEIYNKRRGRALLSNIAELRFPIVPNILAFDWFGDAAAVKDTPWTMFNELKIEDFYFSTGPGVRFTIPQFPLRLLFANTFQVIDRKVKWDEHWKFVLSFNIVNK